MKTAILFVLLLGASLQQAAPVPAEASCSISGGPNQYALSWLSKKGVKINPTPVKYAAAYCNGEWEKNSSCCEVESLRTYIKSQNENIIGKWRSYINQLGRVKNKLMNGLRKLSQKMDLKDLNTKLEMLKRFSAASKFKDVQTLIPSKPAEIEMVKKWIATFDTTLGDYKTQGKTCFETLKKARAGFYCAVCSGAASNYTQPQSSAEFKFKVTVDSCKAIVNACYPVWKFNFGLTSTLQYVSILKNMKRADKADTKYRNEVTMSEADQLAIKETFSICNLEAGEVKCAVPASNVTTVTNEGHILRLCNLAFSINANNAVIEGEESTVADIEDGDCDDAEKDAVTPVVTSRILQAAATTTEPKVGVSAENTGAYGAMTSDNNGLTPESSVDTSKAGEASTTASGFIINVGLVAFLVAFYNLLF